MRCVNCGKETRNDTHCDNCKIANLSLEVDKQKKYSKFLVKLLISSLIILAVVFVLLLNKRF